MNIYLVDIKNEYTNHLCKLLSPLIFEGVQSIYDKAKDCIEEQSLKLFQEYLRGILDWNANTITTETQRIKAGTKSYLEDLLKATIKANMIILAFNPFGKKTHDKKIDLSIYKNINMENFIHHIYIECARELWNNPYLLYHKYSPIDIKRNQRDTLVIIKECIKEGIRKLLPIEDIVKMYLEENATEETIQKITEDLKQFTENEIKEITRDEKTKLDIISENIKSSENFENNVDLENTANTANTVNSDKEDKDEMEINMKGGGESSTSVDLLNKIEMKLNSVVQNTSTPVAKPLDTKQGGNLDSKLENMLGDTNLDTSIDSADSNVDTSLDTSVNYTMENNINNYQEVYGNKK